MADAQLKLQYGHATTNALNYGHLGTATHLEHSGQWVFLRGNVNDTNRLSAQVDQTTISATYPFECIGDEFDDDKPHGRVTVTFLHTDNKKLSKNVLFRKLPDLLPLSPDYHWQMSAKEAQNEELNVGPALRPGQLAFGGAAMSDRKHSQAIPVAAIVSGLNSEAVRLLLIGKESICIGNTYGIQCRYEIPKVDYDEEAYWIGNGDPVQQVCFAAACDHQTIQSTWLAARCRSHTILFHPLFQLTEAASAKPTSRLNPNPLFSIPISRTGGHPHSDVAFHPQDHKRVAIVDVCGNWSVWKIDIPRRSITGRVLYAIHLQSAGKLFPEPRLNFLQNDWHKICWISRAPHEADRILTSSRSNTALFDLNGANLGRLDLRTGSNKDGQIVLDLVKSTINQSHCYILTSTKLLLMSAVEHVRTGLTTQKQMAIIVSWTHFRGRSDLSLSLILVETTQATTILITSTKNRIVTAFRVGLIPEQLPTPVSLADPVHFQFPENDDADGGRTSFTLLAFRNLQLQSRAGTAAREGDPVLFKAFLGRSDHRLEESLYRCRDNRATSTFGQPQSDAIPLSMVHTLQRKSSKYTNAEDLDDFVFADEIDQRTCKKTSGQPLLMETAENSRDTGAKSTTTDWRDMFADWVDSESIYDREGRAVDVAAALDDLQLQLEGVEQRPATVRTLRELLDVKVSVQDFEATSRALLDFAADSSRFDDRQLRITHLISPEGRTRPSTVSDIHDELKASWVQPLAPAEIKIRLTKDRLARSVTADLALASITVGPSPKNDTQADVPQDQSQPRQEYELNSFPSSPPSAAPSVAEVVAEDPACARLRKYTPLSKPIVPLSTSRVLTDMLAHLPTDIHTDPADYNWRATEARIAAEHAAEGADKIDPRARRRAERLAASQRKQLEAQRQIVQAVEQNLAPPIVMSSQYPAVREVQSSQAGPSAQDQEEIDVSVSMTQPARGVFGSRIAPAGKTQSVKKKKSSRKQGF